MSIGLLAQISGREAPSGGLAGVCVFFVIYLALIVLMVASMWIVFRKAGQPGWAAIIPIYNVIVLLQVAGKPIWWIILSFIPIANVVVSILLCIGVSQNFGKGGGFAIGLFLLPIIFYPILAFGSAQYGGAQA